MQLRCPHCQNPIELLGHEALHDVCCPSCGSSFNLISGDPTQSYSESRSLGHFQLIEQLGVGAFGSVWKAQDKELDRTVAIKIPRKDQLSPQETEIFLREARTAAQLRHTNIVSVHEVGREQDTVYIVSDYIDGANLKQWLTSKRLTFREAAELCVVIAEALHAAHESGVVHRDLKPGNILMDLMGRPHITDFGLAKREAGEITMTVEGQILGTPAYMSPEQARGEGHHADRRSDLYSLGVILFELLTGELPFRGETRMLIVQILKDEPPSPRKLNARIPRDLETITLKCLAKDPTRRYPTAAEVAADLQRYLHGEPIQARPVSQGERLVRWCQRNPTLAAMTTTIAALVIIGTVVSTFFAIRANEKASAERKQRERADENSKAASRHLYVAHMNLAQSEWDNARVGAVRELLNRHRQSDLCGFEWFYFDRLCHSDLHTLEGHTNWVHSVVFSPDGKWLASGSHDHTVKVWNAVSGKEIFTFNGHTGSVNGVAFSPDGKQVSSASDDHTLKVWDAMTGQELLTLKGHTDVVTCVAFAPNGKHLASGGHDQIRLWDVTTGKESLIFTGRNRGITSLAFTRDGKRLCSRSYDGTLRVWDTLSGKVALTLQSPTRQPQAVVFSPDGTRLASPSDRQTVKVWDTTNGSEILKLSGHTGEILAVAYSPDGTQLATGGDDQTVRLWNATTGSVLHTLKGHTRSVTSVAFSPDGRRVASTSSDLTVKIWDATSHQESIAIRQHEKAVTGIVFSADGKRLFSGSVDRTIKACDTNELEATTFKGHTASIRSVAISPDGKRLASASQDETVRIWDSSSGQEFFALKGHTKAVWGVAFSPDGKRLASASWDRTVKLWDVVKGQELLTLKGQSGSVQSVAFSPDGKRLASAHSDHTVKVWDTTAGLKLLELQGHTDVVWSVAFSPNGKLLATASIDQSIKIWNSESGAELFTLKGHTDKVWTVAYSPDGRRLASGSSDSTIKLWDATSGELLLTLKGHTSGVNCVAFSADGWRLASASDDQTVKVWDARPWTPELRVEREALSLIRWLRDQEKPLPEWLNVIAANQTISEAVRQRALQFAREWK